jgi:hypothetical protein
MSHLLFYWTKENYQSDKRDGLFNYTLNQNAPNMNAVNIGESVWAFTRRNDNVYVLAAQLGVIQKNNNAPGFKYGKYRVTGDESTSTYYDINAQTDVEPLIRKLVQANASILGRSFQGYSAVRVISDTVHATLMAHVVH